MTNQAVVIHPDLTKAAEVIEWEDGRLLDLLYSTIGCDCIDKGPVLETGIGQMVFWVDDVGLVSSTEPEYNDYAIALARACGWPVGALAGIVVVTGGHDCVGHTLGLSDPLVDQITQSVERARALQVVRPEGE